MNLYSLATFAFPLRLYPYIQRKYNNDEDEIWSSLLLLLLQQDPQEKWIMYSKRIRFFLERVTTIIPENYYIPLRILGDYK